MPVLIPLAAAAVGAGATVFAANSSANASKNAVNAQTEANNAAIGEQQRQYDTTRADQAPWRAVGVGALQQLSQAENIQLPATAFQVTPTNATTADYSKYLAANPDLAREAQARVQDGTFKTTGDYLQWHDSHFGGEGRTSYTNPVAPTPATANNTVNGPGAAPLPAGADASNPFFASPDYQFRFTEGQRAVTGNAAAKGLLDSGALGEGLIKYGAGQATQGYGDWFSHLSSLAGYGQQANAATQAAGQASAGTTSALLQNTGAARSTSIQQQGKTQAGLISGLGGDAIGLIQSLSGGQKTDPYGVGSGLVQQTPVVPTTGLIQNTPDLYGTIL